MRSFIYGLVCAPLAGEGRVAPRGPWLRNTVLGFSNTERHYYGCFSDMAADLCSDSSLVKKPVQQLTVNDSRNLHNEQAVHYTNR